MVINLYFRVCSGKSEHRYLYPIFQPLINFSFGQIALLFPEKEIRVSFVGAVELNDAERPLKSDLVTLMPVVELGHGPGSRLMKEQNHVMRWHSAGRGWPTVQIIVVGHQLFESIKPVLFVRWKTLLHF